MSAIWVGIDSTSQETRVLAMTASETLLKARLCAMVQHPRALPTLLEALALWQGMPVRAALVVDSPDGSPGTRLCLDALTEFGAPPLYTVEFVHGRKARHRDDLDGMGRFADLRQRVTLEVGR
jgi:hypothetical protein